jgi:hypothetical protein
MMRSAFFVTILALAIFGISPTARSAFPTSSSELNTTEYLVLYLIRSHSSAKSVFSLQPFLSHARRRSRLLPTLPSNRTPQSASISV